MILSAECLTPLYTRDSLIVFDEIQRFPKARQSIRRFVKDGRYDYLETGSLISIRENAIAQALAMNGHRLFFYTHYDDAKKRNDIEIGFLISSNAASPRRLR